MTFSHIDQKGKTVNMVNVGAKESNGRSATARCVVKIGEDLFSKLDRDDNLARSIFATAKTAGIFAMKKTGDLIPLCHPLGIESGGIEFLLSSPNFVRIEATAGISAKTGVEMEALTGVSLAALTFYDMCKSADKSIVILKTGLYRKTGGKSGDYYNPDMEWDARATLF